MRLLWQQLSEYLKDRNPGSTGAAVGLGLALSLVVFGFLKTIFIIFLTISGYYIGARYFSDRETIRSWLDKILPPGKFR